ncbi:MAG: NAD(P)/FAD-dependent oxidoreductase [Caulobacteraceae bacterium]
MIVVGAGPMGLAAAYFAARKGYEVEVLEADDRPGGMAAHFQFGDLSLERYYHFCCRSDVDTLALLAELGLPDAMKWVETRMGYFTDGRLFRFGDPLSLLRFTPLTLIERVRYGLMVFLATKRSDWRRLDRISARDWFVGWCGQRVYDKLWRPLFDLKFFRFADRISAAWVWQRIKRLGRSRKSLFQEELGYIEGGTQTLVDALVHAIEANGARIRLSTPARHILVEAGKVRGVETASGEQIEADLVISTAPLPYIPAMLERDAPELATAYTGFDNVAVACVLHKLRRSVSPNFWINISDPAIGIPGLVEFSNLRPTGEVIVYAPYYMPADHPKFGWSDQALLDESFGYLQKVNPALTEADRIDGHVGRLRYAQPVCDVGFAERIPPVQTPVDGLHIADTSFYYPEDRGVSESIKFAKGVVEKIGAP